MRDHMMGWLPVAIAINGVETQPSRRTPSRIPQCEKSRESALNLDKRMTELAVQAKLCKDFVVGHLYQAECECPALGLKNTAWLTYRGEGRWSCGLSALNGAIKYNEGTADFNSRRTFWTRKILRPATKKEMELANA